LVTLRFLLADDVVVDDDFFFLLLVPDDDDGWPLLLDIGTVGELLLADKGEDRELDLLECLLLLGD